MIKYPFFGNPSWVNFLAPFPGILLIHYPHLGNPSWVSFLVPFPGILPGDPFRGSSERPCQRRCHATDSTQKPEVGKSGFITGKSGKKWFNHGKKWFEKVNHPKSGFITGFIMGNLDSHLALHTQLSMLIADRNIAKKPTKHHF